MNLVEYLARAADYLDRHEVASPRLNAELLLADLLGISRIEIYTTFERRLTAREADAYREAVMRRGKGCPLQYITGGTGFRGLELEVREGVFIPRPETEVLVEKALEVAPRGGEGAFHALDIGTGCGNVAVSLAAESEGATVVAVDCDPEAVALCALNAARAGVGDRVKAVEGDLYGPLEAAERFDLVVSNPPYIPSGTKDSLPVEVRDHEPAIALFSGPEGLDLTRRLVRGAPVHMNEGAWLVLEVDESHAGDVVRELEEPAWSRPEVLEDLAGRPRVVRARLGTRSC